jgi:hypothetical protein
MRGSHLRHARADRPIVQNHDDLPARAAGMRRKARNPSADDANIDSEIGIQGREAVVGAVDFQMDS